MLRDILRDLARFQLVEDLENPGATLDRIVKADLESGMRRSLILPPRPWRMNGMARRPQNPKTPKPQNNKFKQTIEYSNK